MRRQNRIESKSKQKVSDLYSDVTLDECANNPLKINVFKNRICLTKISQSLDGNTCSDTINDPDDDDQERTAKPETLRNESNKLEEPLSKGITYPPDIWFQIARHIPPECICQFSLICKDAYKVFLSAQFWKDMLKRFRYKDSLLPIELFTENDSRQGLRARVIRILFFLSPVFVQKISPPVTAQYEPYSLQGLQLLFHWHEKEGKTWNYYFKLLSTGRDIQHHKSELFENSESDYRVLKVTCPEFICISYPQSCYLLTVHLGLTSDMRNQKLTLGLSDYTTTHCTAKVKQNLGRGAMLQTRIILEPVMKCIVTDWWHPEYPYPRINHISNGLDSCSTEEW